LESILIVGATSRLGLNFKNNIDRKSYKIFETSRIVSIDTLHLDLEAIDEFLDKNYSFDYVVIFSAMTDISVCEKNPEKCYLVNTINTKKLVEYFVNKDSYVLCFSTDNVYEGSKPNYSINEIKSPRSVYGKSKAILEDDLNFYLDKVCILRMTKVIDINNKLFKKWLIDLKQHKEINPFHDTYISPVSTAYLTDLLIKIIKRKICGIHQISSEDQISYLDIANYFCKTLNIDQKMIKSVSCKETRNLNCPKYSSLEPTIFEFHESRINSVDALNYFINNQ
jgi:dTDP-4-dehydrorhamnose reductase